MAPQHLPLRNLNSQDRAYLEARYGRAVNSSWQVWGISIVVAALLAWGIWAFLAQINPMVRSGLTSYNIVSPNEVQATFQVTRANPRVEATCVVRVQGKDHSTVGQLTKVIPMTSSTSSKLTVTIRTTRQGYAVMWDGCTAPGQKTPK